MGNRKKIGMIVGIFILFLSPFLSNGFSFMKSNINYKKIHVLVLHLNEKDTSAEQIINLIKKASNKYVQNNIDLILLPENIFEKNIRIEYLKNNYNLFTLQDIIKNKIKKTAIITGATIKEFSIELNKFFVYNAAVKIDGKKFEVITKKRFVPFDENIPFLFSFLEISKDNYTINSRSHVFNHNDISAGIIICYEIFYGEYIGKEECNANVITMLSKEVALGSQLYPKLQYWGISKIRAIEQGKYLIKSSAAGFSGIIDNFGKEQLMVMPDDNSNLFYAEVPLINEPTLYSIYGDYLVFFALPFFLILLVKQLSSKKP